MHFPLAQIFVGWVHVFQFLYKSADRVLSYWKTRCQCAVACLSTPIHDCAIRFSTSMVKQGWVQSPPAQKKIGCSREPFIPRFFLFIVCYICIAVVLWAYPYLFASLLVFFFACLWVSGCLYVSIIVQQRPEQKNQPITAMQPMTTTHWPTSTQSETICNKQLS